jgi:hypothetical protein
MFIGGLNLLFGSEGQSSPAPTVTVTETWTDEPSVSDDDVPDSVRDDGLESLPTPSVCTDADARGVIPRDRWTPCGQILGYFDDGTTSPPASP